LVLSSGRRHRVLTKARASNVIRFSLSTFLVFLGGVGYVVWDLSSGDAGPVASLDGSAVLDGVVSTLWALTATPADRLVSTALPVASATASPVSADSGFGGVPLFPVSPTPPGQDGSVRKDFLLSFYDPDIGRLFPEIALINCHTWNFETRVCESPLGNGEDHRLYYWRALACPKYYPYETVFRVLSPSWLIGDWPCKDHGDLIKPQGEYLDFLLPVNDVMARFDGNINNFPWSTKVETVILLGGQ